MYVHLYVCVYVHVCKVGGKHDATEVIVLHQFDTSKKSSPRPGMFKRKPKFVFMLSLTHVYDSILDLNVLYGAQSASATMLALGFFWVRDK